MRSFLYCCATTAALQYKLKRLAWGQKRPEGPQLTDLIVGEEVGVFADPSKLLPLLLDGLLDNLFLAFLLLLFNKDMKILHQLNLKEHSRNALSSEKHR